MNCTLDRNDYKNLFGFAHAALLDSLKANKPFDLDSEIQSLYDDFKDEDPAFAIGLVQAYPTQLYMALGHTRELSKYHRQNGLSTDTLLELAEEFENIDNVIAKVTDTRITEEEVNEIKEETIQNLETPKQSKKLSPDEIEDSTKSLEKTEDDNFDARNPSAVSSTGNNRKKDNTGNIMDVLDEEQNFYYNILPFFDEAFINSISPENLSIMGHTGFKLKLMSKSKLDVNKHGRLDEQKFVQGKTGGTPANNQLTYNKGVGLFLTDLNGNLLYFDENYNLKSEDEGKPIYFNIRNIKFKDGKYIGSSRNLIPVKDLAKILNISEQEADVIQQKQLKQLYDLRNYVTNTKDDISLDIEGVSRGFLNINFKGDTRIQDIDWENSHVNLNIEIAKRDAPELGQVRGQAYIIIPGRRSIPIQADNLSSDDINKILDLMYNNNLKDESGNILDGNLKKKLVEPILLTNSDGVQFIRRNDGTIKVTLKGKEIKEENKQEIIDFLNTKYINKKGIVTPYNITDGQYAFSEPSGIFNEFDIVGDEVILKQKDFQQHIIEKGSLRIIPNDSVDGKKVITFLNGYFNFSLSPQEAKRVGIDVLEPNKELNKSIEDTSVNQLNITEQVSPEEKVETIQKRKKRVTNIDTNDLNSVKLNKIKATKAQITAAKKWFDNHPISKHIKYEELFNVINSNAWASFVDNGIKLYQGSNYTVLYHEAFHAFTQHFLSKEQKQNLYNEVSKTSAGKKALKEMAAKRNVQIDKLSTYDRYLAVEELLAEDFRQYVLSDGKKVLNETPERNSIFKKLLNFLKELFGKLTNKQFRENEILLNVEELYNQLHIGNINQYSPSAKNAFFGNTALNSAKDFTLDITEQDEQLVLQSIDGIISSYIDIKNNELGKENSSFTSAAFVNPEKYLSNIYDHVFNTLEDKRVEFLELAEKADLIEKEELLRKAKLLDYILEDNIFGTYDLKSGLIGLHLSKSAYLKDQIKNLDQETYSKTQADIQNTKFDVKGNELAKIDIATNRLKFVLSSLKKYTDGKEELNSLGFPILMTTSEVFKKLSIIIGENNQTPRDIYNALEKAQNENPWIKTLLSKMGPTSSSYMSSQNLWTGMWDVFYQSIQRLHSVLVNQTTDAEGNKSFEILTGYAAAVFRQVERDFKSNFKIANNPNKYIIDSGTIGNKLDLKKVLDDFRGKLITPQNKYNFLKAIGLSLSNNKELIADIEKNKIGVTYIYDKLDKYNTNAQTRIKPITDIIQVLRDNINILEEVEGKIKPTQLKSETSNVNKILSLEAKYNENYSNFSVLTVKGNVAYENNRMSTVAVMVQNINKVKDFNELVSIPEMEFLAPKNNPRVKSLTILKSIFKYDKATGTFGDKIPGAYLRFDIADGIQNVEEETSSDKDYSVATSSADSYSRLLQDVYSMVLEGKPSAITPGDKSTITIISVNKLEGTSEDGNLYIDLSDFYKETVDGTNLGIQNAYSILLPQLEAELKEMAMIENHQSDPTSTLPNVLGYTVPDKKGTIRGIEFSAFSGIFDSKLEEKLKSTYAKEGTVKSLREDIIQSFEKYFDKISGDTQKKIKNMLFIDNNMKEVLQKNIDVKLSEKELGELLIKAYTVNKWIHNLEHVTLFYGSTAQFKDLDKRGSAINSTGRMARTDQDMISFLNTQIGRPYANKFSNNGFKEFSPVLNAGIFNDEKVISNYVKTGEYEYEKAIRKTLKERKVPKNKIDSIVNRILQPYKEMETGDAQGWITFDSYRLMSIAENRWSDQQEALFQQIITDPKNVKINDITEYFPVRKYQHFGPMAVEGLPVIAFHKFSLFPLIPGVIDGTKLEDLHHTMIKNGVDYSTYNTGSKVGTIVAPKAKTADNIFLPNGEINTEFNITKNPVHIKYIKDQLDINYEFKGKVIFSTQLRKLIEEGLIANGVPIGYEPNLSVEEKKEKWEALTEDRRLKNKLYNKYKTYESKINKLIKFRTAELINEIGINLEDLESGKTDVSKLITFVKRELNNQDLTKEELNFIGVNSKGELLNDLSLSPSAAQIEKLLNSIVNNRLIRQKVTGEALVQVSNNLFEPKNATQSQLEKYGTKDLRTYRVDPKTGKTLPMEVKIALQGKFLNLTKLLHLDGKSVGVYKERIKILPDGTQKTIRELNEEETLARLNEMITNEEWLSNPDNVNMITMVGVRIPVQGLNSMEFMIVKQFLPARAGNIIVPPAEIVAKSGSDFDVDKLTIMMPSITLVGNQPKIVAESTSEISEEEKIKRIEQINIELSKFKKDKINLKDTLKTKYPTKYELEIRDIKTEMVKYQNIINQFLLFPNLSEDQANTLQEADNKYNLLYDLFNNLTEELDTKNEISEELKKLNDIINKLTEEKASLSGSAIENSILFNIRDILELPENFLSLITPNDTSLVKELADKLAGDREYIESDFASKYFEPAYNLYKHESNSVGKETLGLGAIDNTYNTIFNRIGAYLNPEYTKGEGKKATIQRAVLLMDHNKMYNGISLSHLYDVNNNLKIADIINQLMNGWVDVAKDAWIFDIQGNKQVSPVLLFMIQAGVPFEEAVYFASNPIVKEYVNEQKIAQSAFSKTLGLNPKAASMYKNQAKIKMLKKLNLDHLIKTNFYNSEPMLDTKKLTDYTLNITENKNYSNLAESIYNIKDFNKAKKSRDAVGAFLHYLELEEIAGHITDLKSKLNYDTSRSNSLFEAAIAEANLETIRNNDIFPPSVVEGILKESPISSFRVAPLQLKLWSSLFNIRNDQKINDYLITLLKNSSSLKKMKKRFGTPEKYVENFKNDLVVKIFSNTVKSFNLIDNYKGINLKESSEIKEVQGLKRGIAVLPNEKGDLTIYFDKALLNYQFNNQMMESNDVNNPNSYKSLGLATVPFGAFIHVTDNRLQPDINEFYRFSIEREYQRHFNPFSEMSKTHYFKFKYENNLVKFKDKITELPQNERERRILQYTYEEILRNKALNNILNTWKLFKSSSTIVDELFEIKEMHKNLESKYNIVRDLVANSLEQTKRNRETGEYELIDVIKNITLRDNRLPSEDMNIYQTNMTELADPDIFSIPISEENYEQDRLENKRIADFFNDLPLIGFLQSGLNSKDTISIMKAMPTSRILEVINPSIDSYKKIMSGSKAENFLNNYKDEFNAQNSTGNIAIRKRIKNYSSFGHFNLPNIELSDTEYDTDITLPMQFDSDFNLLKEGRLNATTRPYSSNVKKGDIVEFRKNFKDHTESIKVIATSDEYLVNSISETEWMLLENKSDTEYNNSLDGFQFTFESLLENSKENEKLIDNNTKLISNFTELTGVSEYELKVPYEQLEEVRNRLTCKL